MKRSRRLSWCLTLLMALPVWGAEPHLMVAPFQDANPHPAATGLETVLQDLLITRLSRVQSVVVLDRTEIDRLYKEHRLSVRGTVDPETAVKTGKLLGADILVLGGFTLTGGKLQVHARVINVASAAIVATEEITSAQGDLIETGDQLGGRLLEDLHLKTDRAVSAPTDQAPAANLCFMRGVAFFLSAQYDAAQAQFLKARQMNPQNREALLWSGRCYLEQKKYTHAVIALSQFINQPANEPELGQARRGLAECQKHLKPEEKQFLAELQKGS